MKQIYLIRHGQSLSNAGGDAQPNAHIELTELGKRQAREVAAWLSEAVTDEVNSINVSKFIRTHQTAKPFVEMTGIEPTIIEGLHEFDYLSFNKIDGTSLAQRRQMADDYWVIREPQELEGEDAESYQAFCDRVGRVLEHFKTLEDGNHVVYTHGLWISMLIWQLLGQPNDTNDNMRKFRQFELSIRARNCEVFLLTLKDGHPPAITKVRSCELAPKDIHLT